MNRSPCQVLNIIRFVAAVHVAEPHVEQTPASQLTRWLSRQFQASPINPPDADIAATRGLWTEVVRQVDGQSCYLGVHAVMPPNRH